jgi:hypothetical protein
VQVVLGVAMLPPVKLMPVVPAVAVAVPLQELVSAFGVATTNPVGSVSAKATPVSAAVLAAGFVIVNVRAVIPFNATVEGLNAFAIEGGATTMTLADAVPPVPPCVEVTAPVVLFCAPAAMPVTFTLKLHEPLCAIVEPARVTTFVACVAVIVPPPHVPVRPLGVETTRPAGSVSVNAMAARLCVVLLFWMVKVSEVVPFNGIEAAPNALMITGGPITVIDGLDVFPDPPFVELA